LNLNKFPRRVEQEEIINYKCGEEGHVSGNYPRRKVVNTTRHESDDDSDNSNCEYEVEVEE
jgi:hypothetical protein